MRKIIHCDADCFFAAVEMRDNPRLREVPMAITGSLSRRGVVSTCNYEARRYGIHSAMPTWQARSLCPDLLLVPHSMDKYREASRQIRKIFGDYTDLVENVSIDESYLDVSATPLCRGSATLLAREIRARVAREVGVTVSAGVAPNKFLAKVASEWRKPDGLFVIPPPDVDDFMVNLPVECIQGVGSKTARKLHNMGVSSCGDLQQWSLDVLVSRFGRFGKRLFESARGIDRRAVVTSRIRKSLSVEHTYTQDLTEFRECRLELKTLFERLSARLERFSDHYEVRKLQAKVKFNNFRQTTTEVVAGSANLDTYFRLVRQGMERENLPVRLLGIGVQFDDPAPHLLAGNQLPLVPAEPASP